MKALGTAALLLLATLVATAGGALANCHNTSGSTNLLVATCVWAAGHELVDDSITTPAAAQGAQYTLNHACAGVPDSEACPVQVGATKMLAESLVCSLGSTSTVKVCVGLFEGDGY
jgi:hypothetical protein